jgi:hypothetical protein
MTTYYDSGNYGITNDGQYLWINNYVLDAVYKHYMIRYPIDPYMTIGENQTWNYSGVFNTTDQTDDFHEVLQDAVDSCTPDGDGYCTIPIYLTGTEGWINITRIEINYTSNLNPVYINTDLIKSYIGSASGYVDIPIKIESSQNGTINVNDIRYDYKGGNDTVSLFIYESGDLTNNETRNITYFYSDYNQAMPYTWTDAIFFLPKSNSSKNVSAYGQTTTIPLFNITGTNYGGKDFNLSIKINESISCLNLTWSTTSTKPSGNKINTTWQKVFSNIGYLESGSIWIWADLDNCNASDKRILQPKFEMESYCIDCVWEGK